MASKKSPEKIQGFGEDQPAPETTRADSAILAQQDLGVKQEHVICDCGSYCEKCAYARLVQVLSQHL